MGGLIGKLSFDPLEPLARPVLEQMLDASTQPRGGAQARRAADVFLAPGIALGVCGGDLAPSSTHAIARLRVAADATITNGPALRRELEDLGHRFTGRTPGELILRAYEHWGTASFARLRGPFACAIWDSAERRLVIARDHVGLRPIYFAVLPNHGLVFATEIRALLCDPGVPREWCAAAIDAYLALGYVPAPLTAYRRVSKLESAHFLVVEGRSLHLEQYWDIPAPQSIAGDEAIDELAHELRRVMRHQAADGRITGVLYSGGTGSTALLASAPRSVVRVVTVSVDQDGASLARSDAAASRLGYTREIESVEPQVPLLARDLAAHCDEPIADPAAISRLALCTAARRQTDCAFAAAGAATLWGGHAHHRPSSRFRFGGARANRLSVADGNAMVARTDGLWDDHYRRSLYTRGFAWEVRESNPFARHQELYVSRDTTDPLDRVLYVDARTYLPDSELIVAGHAAATAGLETRYPLLDPLLVARAGLTPGSLKQRAGFDMYALRRVLAPALPAELMPPARRPRPTHAWLEASLLALVPSVLLSPRFDGRGIVSRPALRQLWEEHCTGHGHHAQRLWALLMLEFWFRDLIDGDAAEEPLEYAVLKAA